ncbi:MAG: hypothetical protein ACREFR_13215, partial [Limisphaerales bacterium]
MKILAVIAFITIGFLAGCSVGPNYHRPSALPAQPLPQSFSTVKPGANEVIWEVAQPSANAPRGQWWRMFGDVEMDRLELLALTNNQNIVASAAQFEQARQLMIEARSEFYPELTAGGTPDGDISRQETSVNAPASGAPAGAEYTYN